MLTRLKRLARTLLEKRGIYLFRWIPGQVSGVNLTLDISAVVSRAEPIVFDVGANIGQSIDLFRCALPNAQIFAFEPSEACRLLLRDRRSDPRVTVLPFALGSREERREFKEYESSLLSSLLPLDTNQSNRFRNVALRRKVDVDVRTVDSLRKELGVARIDLLKIDTQGFDLAVLEGATESLSEGRISAVLVEINFVPMYVGQAPARNIISFLEDHEFELVDYYEKVRQGTMVAWCTALYARKAP